jgi:hypothetical protein
MANRKAGRTPSQQQLLDFITTLEILVYRTAVIISFLVYAFRHLKHEIGY